MEFEQIIFYDWHTSEIEGVLNFRLESITSFSTLKGEPGFAYLRVANGNERAYKVNYDDLKKILDAYPK